jgi:hypothetical protein
MKKRYWRIRGYDGEKEIFAANVGLGQFTEGQIKHLLRALAAKAGLTDAEIVGAYAKRKTKLANDLLCVQKDFNYPTYMCGDNPTFIAGVVDDQGKITRHASVATAKESRKPHL